MNNLSKNIFLLIMFVLGFNITHAQTFNIPDANFKQFLVSNYPNLFDANQALIIDSAKVLNGKMICSNKAINDLSGIEYFMSIDTLDCSKNNLSSFPDISKVKSFKYIDVSFNKLSSLSYFSYLFSLNYLDCSNNRLTTINELRNFKNLEYIACNNNAIQSLPELDSLKNLEYFIVNHNLLKKLPNLSNNIKLLKIHCHNNLLDSIGSLKTLVNLKSLRFARNNIKVMPDISANVKLQTLHGSYNSLSSLPDISDLNDMSNVQLYYNDLTFEDIMPLRSHLHFVDFQLYPQNPIIDSVDVSVTKGGSVELNFKINQADSLFYSWYCNDVLIGTSTKPYFNLYKVNEINDGKYSCTITSKASMLTDMSILARLGNVNVTPCITFPNINYQITSNDCSKGASVEIDDSQIVAPFGPLKFVLTSAGNKSIETNNKKVDGLVPGKYSLTISDTNNCAVSLQNYIYIPNSTSCVASFTPNGDGIEDMFFIEQPGVAKIYDKNGVLVRTLNTPQAWDGCSDGGAQLDMGYYVIVVNAKDKIGVVLVD